VVNSSDKKNLQQFHPMKSLNADFIAERNVDCKTLAKNRFLMPNDLTSNSVNCACCLLLINFMNPIYSLTGRPSPNIASVLSISYDGDARSSDDAAEAFTCSFSSGPAPSRNTGNYRATRSASCDGEANGKTRRDATRRRDVQSRRVSVQTGL